MSRPKQHLLRLRSPQETFSVAMRQNTIINTVLNKDIRNALHQTNNNIVILFLNMNPQKWVNWHPATNLPPLYSLAVHSRRWGFEQHGPLQPLSCALCHGCWIAETKPAEETNPTQLFIISSRSKVGKMLQSSRVWMWHRPRSTCHHNMLLSRRNSNTGETWHVAKTKCLNMWMFGHMVMKRSPDVPVLTCSGTSKRAGCHKAKEHFLHQVFVVANKQSY